MTIGVDAPSNHRSAIRFHGGSGHSVESVNFYATSSLLPGATVVAVSADRVAGLTLTGNRVTGLQFKLGSHGGGPVTLVSNNTFTDSHAYAITYVAQSNTEHSSPSLSDIVVANNVISTPVYGGVYIGPDGDNYYTATLSRVSVTGNLITGSGTNFIPVLVRAAEASDNVLIANNVIATSGSSHCIRIKGTESPTRGSIVGLTVSANQVSGCALGVDVTGIALRDFVIANNRLRGAYLQLDASGVGDIETGTIVGNVLTGTSEQHATIFLKTSANNIGAVRVSDNVLHHCSPGAALSLVNGRGSRTLDVDVAGNTVRDCAVGSPNYWVESGGGTFLGTRN